MPADDRTLLTAFADHGTPASSYEATRRSITLAEDAALRRLLDAGHLEQTAVRDAWGGARYRVTAAGYAALGRAAPAANVAQVAAGKRRGR